MRSKAPQALRAATTGFAPIFFAVVTAIGSATVARAGNPPHDAGLQPASYTTSQSGASLEWRPHRATKVHEDKQVKPVRHSESVELMASGQAATKGDPFSDPFGDGKPRMLPVAQQGQVSAKALGEVMVPSDRVPEFPAEGPATMERRVAGSSAGSALQPLPDLGAQLPTAKPGDEPTGRSLEDELAAVRQDLRGRCPSADKVSPIADIKLWTRPREGNLPPECSLGEKEFPDRCFSPITYTWKASSLCHKPLVFEEKQLERYGHTLHPIVQPFCSAAHFFGCVPLMPYIYGVEPPNECVYTLGYYRPGSCAPYTLDPFPLSVRGALFEAAAVTGFVFLLP